jgi:hypothetical protein
VATPRTKNGVLSSRATSDVTGTAHKPSLPAGGHPSSSCGNSKLTFMNWPAVPLPGLISSTASACLTQPAPARAAFEKRRLSLHGCAVNGCQAAAGSGGSQGFSRECAADGVECGHAAGGSGVGVAAMRHHRARVARECQYPETA